MTDEEILALMRTRQDFRYLLPAIVELQARLMARVAALERRDTHGGF